MSQINIILILTLLFVFLLSCTDQDNPTGSNNYNLIQQEFVLVDTINITMIWIPEGQFHMGGIDTEDDDDDDNECPIHIVQINQGFWMGKYEVTQAQWEAVMGENPADEYGVGDNFPVYNVSWDNIHTFLESVHDTFRLPSEAEWEYACRAGSNTRWYWGDNESEISDYEWHFENGHERTHEVGQKKPNPWSLHDMSGNVCEWCEDDYHSDYDNAPTDGSAWIETPRGYGRVVRYGSFWDSPDHCRASARRGICPFYRYSYLGFRLVRSAE